MADGSGGPRLARSVINGELREPLGTLARSLQRLSLQHVATPNGGATPAARLLRRARSLADELDQVVAELAELAAPTPGPVLRSGQEPVSLAPLLEGIVAEIAASFDRAHVLECSADLTINSDLSRLRTILMNVIAATARTTSAGFGVHASAVDRTVTVAASWTSTQPAREILDGDPGLTLALTLVRSLGGDLTVVDLDGARTLLLTLPQQREGDTGDRP